MNALLWAIVVLSALWFLAALFACFLSIKIIEFLEQSSRRAGDIIQVARESREALTSCSKSLEKLERIEAEMSEHVRGESIADSVQKEVAKALSVGEREGGG